MKQRIFQIKAVIFDLDGTLIDTEKYYRKCWPIALEHFGYHMTDEQALSLRSLGRPFAPKALQEMFGDPKLDYYKVREYRKGLVAECIRKEGISLKPGLFPLLEFLRERGIRTAIATANDPARTEQYLKGLGLSGCFDRIVCATEVREGKPSPDVYLYACEQLGEKPEHCMAVEDSPNGIISAYRAGCPVVMVPDLTEPDEKLSEMLYARVDNLAEIQKIL